MNLYSLHESTNTIHVFVSHLVCMLKIRNVKEKSEIYDWCAYILFGITWRIRLNDPCSAAMRPEGVDNEVGNFRER